MALRDWINGSGSVASAIPAIPAIPAISEHQKDGTLATLATIALAEPTISDIPEHQEDGTLAIIAEIALAEPEATNDFPPLEMISSYVSPEQWILNNSDELVAAGYTHEDLHGHKCIPGVAYLTLWDKPGLSVRLEDDVIAFYWQNSNGRTIRQRCPPEVKP